MIGSHPAFSIGIAAVLAFSLDAQALPVAPEPECALVQAEPGEGIWGILRRNGVTPSGATVSAFKETNKSRLKDGDSLIQGAKYCLPGADVELEEEPRTVEVPLFGESHSLVELQSDALAGHVYYIVSGHGGRDPGTMAKYRGRWIAEDELAYDTALRLARELMAAGATVHVIVQDPNDGIRDAEILSPDQDERFENGKAIPRGHNDRLVARVDLINSLYDQHRPTARSQQVISLHVDAYGRTYGPRIDLHFAYASDSGRTLGRVLQSSVSSQYERYQPGRGYNGRIRKRAELQILNDTKPTAVLVELGNIKNPSDQIRLVKPSNRQALAEWIAAGLREAAGARRN